MRDTPSRENNSRPTRRRRKPVLFLVLLVIFTFSLLSQIGLFGDVLRDFFAGAFGFLGYAYFALALIVLVARALGRRKKFKLRTILFVVVLSLLVLVYIQIMTSLTSGVYHDEDSFGRYCGACYDKGLKTSGGVVLAWISYPLLSWMGRWSVIPLAVAFFVILFFALLPLMKGSKPADDRDRGRQPAPQKQKAGKERKPSPIVDEKKPLLLFVDRVRPGQKDAQKIKTKGLFAKKKEEISFFDFRDKRMLADSEGVVPEERPERYRLYGDRGGVTARDMEEDWEDYPIRGNGGGDARYAERLAAQEILYPDRKEQEDDLPPFVKRYAEEKAQANRVLYGEESASDILPDEPRYDSFEPDTYPKEETPEAERPFASAPEKPAPAPEKKPDDAFTRPAPRVDDIIQDMDDLNRIREKEERAPKSPRFMGEDLKDKPAPKASEEIPLPPFVTQRFTKEEPEVESDSIEEGPIFEQEPKEAPIPPVRKTITPSDASMLEPKEEPSRAMPPRAAEEKPSPVAPPKPGPLFEEDDDLPLRTRKPRSDIGGTHRVQGDRPVDTYIPPKKAQQIDLAQAMKEEEETPARPYTPPPVNLLKDIPAVQDESDVEERKEMLVRALASFNVSSEVIDHKTGPTFTRFAVTLPDNMSVNKLTPIEKDIKRKLKVDKDIRIIPSVPGMDAIGVEVPNKKTSMVGLRSIISAPEFAKEGKLYFAIGVDVSGKAIYGDLLKMPHLLVAGSTGSGKSVCLNVMICSIMYHYSPEVVRFIMVDPKKVELSVYENMPHMLMQNTVTEPDKAINALNWAVNEMERRYMLLKENSCRNIGEYNEKQAKTGGKKLYYIVIIVDEMADLMTAAKKDVEEKVSRIAAKARAAGIHLVVATQRPSVDVITGTIKNNIPTRIAFKVTSYIDSKTILDRAGAESLFGNGDMLYMPPDGGDPLRLQGPYINNEEIEEVVSFVKKHNDTRFDGEAERIIQADKPEVSEVKSGDGEEEGSGEDEFFSSALLYFIKTGQASISKLQIKYRIGYGRAARIVDTMSERGYLGPSEGGNKPRSVLITLDQYYELYGEDGIDGNEV